MVSPTVQNIKHLIFGGREPEKSTGYDKSII
jgi:hypothetical protein